MGNRALRKEAAAALKEAGYGKLYKGRKLRMYKYLRAHDLRRIIDLAKLRVGDYVNDCDGFNHQIAEIRPRRAWWGVMDFDQFVFTDGRWSCGCPSGPDDAWTNEQIRDFHNIDDEWIQNQKDGGWWSDKSQKLIDRIRSGEPITDEHGCKLPLE